MERKQKYPADHSKEIFPQRLTALTKERGGQSDLANAIGKTRQMINHYCNGKYQPDCDTLVMIAQYYGVSVDWLLGVNGAPKVVNADKRAVMEYTGLSEKSVDFLNNLNSTQVKSSLDAVNEILSSNYADFLICRIREYVNSFKHPCDSVQIIHNDGCNTEIYDSKSITFGSISIDENTARYSLLKHIGTILTMICEDSAASEKVLQNHQGKSILTDKNPDDIEYIPGIDDIIVADS